MQNLIKTVGEAISNKLSNMDMATIGKWVGTGMMLAGGVIIFMWGNASTDAIKDLDIKVDVADAKPDKIVEPTTVIETVADVVENVATE